MTKNYFENMACVKYSVLNKCQTCLGDPVETSRIESLHVSEDMVSLLTYFNIQICEGLSNTICSICIQTLEKIITFKHQCVVSQTFLQNQYQEYLRTNAVEDIKPNIEKNDSMNNVLPVEIKVDNIKEEIEDDCTAFTATNTTFTATDYNQVDISYSLMDGNTEKKESPAQCKKEEKIIKKENDISCAQCSFKCNSDLELTTHCQNKHDRVCNICSRVFKHKRYLVKHKEVHKDRPKVYCILCKKFYTTQKAYEIHMQRLHDNNREKTTCSLCGIAVYGIQDHMRFCHNNSPVSFPCTYCKKVFKSNHRMRAHTLIFHENSERYVSLCPECGKVFRTPSELKQHYKYKHTNTYDYHCRFCERKFKMLKACNKHEKKAHPEELPYKCEICSKVFPLQSSLDEHAQVHTSEKER